MKSKKPAPSPKPASGARGAERRKAPRRPIVDSFALFIVIPSKGAHRLQIHDVSELGLGFDVDAEGEDPTEHPLTKGDSMSVHFYVNRSLYLPLDFEILRIEERDGVRRVGGEIARKKGKEYSAFLSFLKMLDQLNEAGRLATG